MATLKQSNSIQYLFATFFMLILLDLVVGGDSDQTLIASPGVNAAAEYQTENKTDSSIFTRIYNGRKAEASMLPFIVFIVLRNKTSPDDYSSCAGSILDGQWILTAAHCIYHDRGADKDNRLFVWVGAANDVTKEDVFNPRNGQYIPVQVAIVHPNYNSNTNANDIALYKLQRPISLNTGIGTICIGNNNYDNYNDVYLGGWGKYNCKDNGGIFRNAIGYTLDIRDCIAAYKQDSMTVTNTQICARLRGNDNRHAEQAKGDSGGPLYVIVNNLYVQIGVVSFDNKNPDTLCPRYEYPGVYARTASYVNWIKIYIPRFTCPNA